MMNDGEKERQKDVVNRDRVHDHAGSQQNDVNEEEQRPRIIRQGEKHRSASFD